ncbi:MAG: alpha-galactosidase [Verrucomicrobiota bacterium]
MPNRLLSEFTLGSTTLRYLINETKVVGLTLYPTVLKRKVVPRRETIDHLPEIQSLIRSKLLTTVPAWNLASLVQVKILGDDAAPASSGRSTSLSETSARLRYVAQKVRRHAGRTEIVTTVKHPSGLFFHHRVVHCAGDVTLRFSVTATNRGARIIALEALSSFALGGLSPFAAADACEQLIVHRFRSAWSAEGRHEAVPLEALHLENSWSNQATRAERFGQVGTFPTNGFFPFVALEDRRAGVIWGAQLAWPGSWQMEIFRRDDAVNLAGGLADYEFGHWKKNLRKGETLETPPAHVACVRGGIEELSHELTDYQGRAVAAQPAVEQGLPVVFNEWCTSWGRPDHRNLGALAKSLQGTGVKYLVIDAGWFAQRPDQNWGANGDWIPNPVRFPGGIRATCDAIRACGLIPGVWFEFENSTPGSKAFAIEGHKLTREGHLVNQSKHQWDFRDPWVQRYLDRKVIQFLRANGIGYMKVDYNDTCGIGVDGAESLGEGLRQHVVGVLDYFHKIRRELPGLVLENCSSGGHRLEPALMGLCAMGSFSDAHEGREIPIIAANLHRLIHPRQSQVWAVLHPHDEEHRMVYSLTAGFLGRLCLSGEFDQLDSAQRQRVQRAIALYQRVAPIIKNGYSRRYGPELLSYRHPRGWQAVVRTAASGRRALVVAHVFGKPHPKTITIPLPPPGRWQITGALTSQKRRPTIRQGVLRCPVANDFCGLALELELQ